MSSSPQVLYRGLIAYEEARAFQKATVREVCDGAPDKLILCEHPAILTLGRNFQEKNLFFSRDDLAQKGVSVIEADRGGDVTLHAPGQLVIYPIINLKRAGLGLRDYLQKLEQVAVDFLGDFGIVAQGDDDRRGVWVGKAKIASIGVGVSRWVTYHGMGLNITTDLELFRLIRPCGLDVRMTSLKEIKQQIPDMPDLSKQFAAHFIKVFQW